MSDKEMESIVRSLANRLNKKKDRNKRYLALTTNVSLLLTLTTESPADAFGVLENVKLTFWEMTKEEKSSGPSGPIT